jgi:hypothetical protein
LEKYYNYLNYNIQIMDKIYNQIIDKAVTELTKPELKKKLNQHIIDPLIQDIYQKTHNYFITIITLYGITILLLLIILSLLITKKNIHSL